MIVKNRLSAYPRFRNLSIAGVGAVCGMLVMAVTELPDPKITIDNFSFGPAELEIKSGTTLTWVNHDDIPHTVVSSDLHMFRSKPLDSDDSFSHVFDKTGTFKYFCSLHPKMQGTIIVK